MCIQFLFFDSHTEWKEKPQRTQRQARSSQRILRELRENPCLPAGRFVTLVVKNRTFISE